MIKTEIGYTTPDRITVRGKDLADEVIGKIDFVDMIIFTFYGRLPDEREKRMLNVLLVTTADHGLTPSAISARLTYLGAPEALQGAVAAGLLGAGSVFLGNAQNVTEMLQEGAAALADDAGDAEILAAARSLVASYRDRKRHIYGVGHNIHVDGDPRVPTLQRLSKENGYFGKYWKLMLALETALTEALGRRMPLNTAGAVGAIVAEMDLDPLLGRGVALIGRCAGLIAHVAEERDAPIGRQIWDLVLEQDSRNTLPPTRK